jgi:hypothetical protein
MDCQIPFLFPNGSRGLVINAEVKPVDVPLQLQYCLIQSIPKSFFKAANSFRTRIT